MMNPSLANMLAEFAAAGGTFAECKDYFGVATEGDAYASKAKTLYSREGAVEFDEITVLSKADAGAYVMAWVWVGNSDLPKYHQFAIGDKVFWTDPDNGACSGTRIVDSILSESGKIESDETVVLLKDNDSLTEAFAGELSSVQGDDIKEITAEKQPTPRGQETMDKLNVLTLDEFHAVTDPQPGIDPAWDTLTDSEKECFRRPQLANGKSLSDLLKDRDALEMPTVRGTGHDQTYLYDA